MKGNIYYNFNLCMVCQIYWSICFTLLTSVLNKFNQNEKVFGDLFEALDWYHTYQYVFPEKSFRKIIHIFIGIYKHVQIFLDDRKTEYLADKKIKDIWKEIILTKMIYNKNNSHFPLDGSWECSQTYLYKILEIFSGNLF